MWRSEVIGARAVFERRTLPALREGDIWRAIKSSSSLGSGFCRLKIPYSLSVLFHRCVSATTLLEVTRAAHGREDCTSTPKSEMKLT
jgi:hypothetical protein